MIFCLAFILSGSIICEKTVCFLHEKQTTGSGSVKLNSACLNEAYADVVQYVCFTNVFSAALTARVSAEPYQVLSNPDEEAEIASHPAAERQV